MGKVCLKCGKKPNFFGNDPMKLSEDKILCYTCAKPLADEIEILWGIDIKDQFVVQKNKVLDIAIKNYPENIIDDIRNKIENIYQYKQKVYMGESEWNVGRLEEEKLQKQIDSHTLTTGYDFEGYSIKKYIKVISGEVVMGTGMFSELAASLADLVGEESEAFNQKLKLAKENALRKMIINSINLGGNAIIGVDFDYVTFDKNMIGVIANGTCVYIERIEQAGYDNSCDYCNS